MNTTDTYGEWTIIGDAEPRNYKRRVICRCSCGNVKEVFLQNLTRGLSRGCSSCCKQRKDNYHGMSNTKTYAVWAQMIARCHYRLHRSYYNYGHRGISVCRRWRESFTNFLVDMGEAPDGLTIERIDNDGDYTKSNCIWGTRKQQSQNRRNSIRIGEVSNGWCVISRGDKPKSYNISCMHCSRECVVSSCNFRTRKPCNCSTNEEI